MREIRPSGSAGGAGQLNAPFLPRSIFGTGAGSELEAGAELEDGAEDREGEEADEDEHGQ